MTDESAFVDLLKSTVDDANRAALENDFDFAMGFGSEPIVELPSVSVARQILMVGGMLATPIMSFGELRIWLNTCGSIPTLEAVILTRYGTQIGENEIVSGDGFSDAWHRMSERLALVLANTVAPPRPGEAKAIKEWICR